MNDLFSASVPTVTSSSGPDAAGRSAAQLRRQRHRLVVVLTFVTGCADAMGFLALGGAFSSVMTGNMVLLGLSSGSTDLDLAISSASAIGAYVVGVLLGARIAGNATGDDEVWPRSVTWTLGVELAALAGLCLVWELTLGGRSDLLQLTLLSVLAAALGMQGSAVQRFGVPGLSSTYLTGTLTSLIVGVAHRHPGETLRRHALVLVALVIGAGVGSVLVFHAEPLTPLFVVAPLAFVVVASVRLRAREARSGARR